MDPGELPPGHKGPPPRQLVTKIVAGSDGIKPLAVAKDQNVLVRVEFKALNNGGQFNGTLVIQGDTWDPINVPLSCLVAGIQTTFGSQMIAIAQGGTATLPITVKSLGGPATNATYTLNTGPGPFGITMDPLTVAIGQNATVQATLGFHATSSAPLGSFELFVQVTAFDGARPNNPVPNEPSITVIAGQVGVAFVNQGGIVVQPGGSATVPVIATARMSADDFVSISLEPANLRRGVTMRALQEELSDNPDHSAFLPPHNVDANGSRTFNLTMNVDPDAPSGKSTLTINWTATVLTADARGPHAAPGSSPQLGSITTSLDVLPQAIAFSSGTLGPSTTTASAQWTLNAQGFWNFTGRIHESGLVGHAYGFGMALNVKDANGVGFAAVHSGSVDANLPLMRNDDSWSDSGGPETRIIDNWPSIVSARSSVELNVTTNAIYIFDAVIEALGVVVVAVLVAAGVGHLECDEFPTVERSPDGSGVDLVWHCH